MSRPCPLAFPSPRAAWACVPSTATSGARGRLARGQGVPAGVKYILKFPLQMYIKADNVLGVESHLRDLFEDSLQRTSVFSGVVRALPPPPALPTLLQSLAHSPVREVSKVP